MAPVEDPGTAEFAREPSTTAAVVLAAGHGSRYEGATHKLRAPFRGRPLVCWAVDAALAAGLDDVYVVTGAVGLEDILPDEVTIIENHNWADGQATSLRAAVELAHHDGHDAVVVGLADMPLVPASAWRAVAEAEGRLVSATYSGRRLPPVKIVKELWSLLPLSGDEGARALMRLRPDVVEEVACEGESIDIDTRGDLARWS